MLESSLRDTMLRFPLPFLSMQPALAVGDGPLDHSGGLQAFLIELDMSCSGLYTEASARRHAALLSAGRGQIPAVIGQQQNEWCAASPPPFLLGLLPQGVSNLQAVVPLEVHSVGHCTT